MAKRMIQVKGLKELRSKLKQLEKTTAGKALEEAALAGAEVWREAAVARAPGPFIEKEVLEGDDDKVEVGVGPDRKHWYYQFAELGAAPHTITAKPLYFGADGEPVVTLRVQHPGAPARPFLRPAADENADAAVEAIKKALRRGIDKLTK